MIVDTRGKKYEYEGEFLTISEIHLRVPAYSKPSIQRYVDKGANSKATIDRAYAESQTRIKSQGTLNNKRRTMNNDHFFNKVKTND